MRSSVSDYNRSYIKRAIRDYHWKFSYFVVSLTFQCMESSTDIAIPHIIKCQPNRTMAYFGKRK